MANNGYLTPFTGKDQQEGFIGEIRLQAVKGRIALKPVEKKQSGNSPDFDIMIDRGDGAGWIDWGCAWNKTSKKGLNFLSLCIQPEGEPDINLPAFPPEGEDDGEKWVIVRSRPRGGSVGAAARAHLPTDEIPY